MPIREVSRTDTSALLAFLDSIPDPDRAFLKDDAQPEALVERWIRTAAPPLVAVDGDAVLGMVGIRQGAGASRHVGEITLLVDPRARRRGVGSSLAHVALLRAVQAGMTHIFVEVSAEQVGTIRMFERLGFTPEALLRDFVRDTNGDHHDLIVMTHAVMEHWAEAQLLGLGAETS